MTVFNPGNCELSPTECYELIAFYGLRAIRFKKIPNETMYHQEVNLLAKTCSHLIHIHQAEPHHVITKIETALIEACQNERIKIEEDIQLLFNKRKHISSNSSQGESEITKMTMQIAELEKRKSIPSENHIPCILYDTVQEASRAGIKFSDDIYVAVAKHQNLLKIIPSTLNEELSVPVRTSFSGD